MLSSWGHCSIYSTSLSSKTEMERERQGARERDGQLGARCQLIFLVSVISPWPTSELDHLAPPFHFLFSPSPALTTPFPSLVVIVDFGREKGFHPRDKFVLRVYTRTHTQVHLILKTKRNVLNVRMHRMASFLSPREWRNLLNQLFSLHPVFFCLLCMLQMSNATCCMGLV